MIIGNRFAVAGLCGLVLAATLTGPAAAATRPAGTQATAVPAAATQAAATQAAVKYAGSDRTSAVEARRVDRVPAPKLNWTPCLEYAECTTARLPLDYDNPRGATTQLGLLRIKAKNPQQRLGSLFVNPGGPGGSSTALAYAAPYFLSQAVLDRFDIVGVDPRGVGFSDNLRCFRSPADQAAALAGLGVPFPYTRAEEKAFIASARAFGRACSTTGRPLAGAMSTAEVARDMEVLRRSVGDQKLTYLGFSYGSILGQYYANMFPDRTRSLVIDGVVDPTQWVGTRSRPDTATFDRIRSADASHLALREVLRRCDRAGARLCALADGDPVRRFDAVARRLRSTPVVITDPEAGDVEVTYAVFIAVIRSVLYDPNGYRDVIDITTELETLTAPPAGATPAARAAARTAVGEAVRRAGASRLDPEEPYDNSYETLAAITCTDTVNPRDAAQFPALAARADRRAPYFGRSWAWLSPWCARNTWTVHDEDAYRGPFTRRTATPVLVVGNYWDPATNYTGATAAARLLPNSRLLSSDSWGHTAYGSSDCATSAIDKYLITGQLPARGTVCTGDVQPFAGQNRAAGTARTTRPSTDIDELAGQGRPAPGAPKQLPPVVTPGSNLR